MGTILNAYNSHSDDVPPLRAPAPRPMLARRLKDLPLLLVAGLLLLPVLAVLGSWFSWNAASGQILREMAATVLPDYALTSLVLCVAVAIGAAVVGTAGAAAVTLFDFAGRRHFEWALLLPLA